MHTGVDKGNSVAVEFTTAVHLKSMLKVGAKVRYLGNDSHLSVFRNQTRQVSSKATLPLGSLDWSEHVMV